jgi:hypothetical protein
MRNVHRYTVGLDAPLSKLPLFVRLGAVATLLGVTGGDGGTGVEL